MNTVLNRHLGEKESTHTRRKHPNRISMRLNGIQCRMDKCHDAPNTHRTTIFLTRNCGVKWIFSPFLIWSAAFFARLKLLGSYSDWKVMNEHLKSTTRYWPCQQKALLQHHTDHRSYIPNSFWIKARDLINHKTIFFLVVAQNISLIWYSHCVLFGPWNGIRKKSTMSPPRNLLARQYFFFHSAKAYAKVTVTVLMRTVAVAAAAAVASLDSIIRRRITKIHV